MLEHKKGSLVSAFKPHGHKSMMCRKMHKGGLFGKHRMHHPMHDRMRKEMELY